MNLKNIYFCATIRKTAGRTNMNKYALAVIILITAGTIYAQDAKPAATVKDKIAYTVYLDQITVALPEVKSNTISVLQASNAVKKAKSSGDISVNGSGTYMKSNQLSVTSTGPAVGTVDGYDYNAGVSKVFTSTGTNVSANIDYSKNSYSDFGYDYSTYTPAASLRVTQPLLYNFLGKIDSFSEKDAVMKEEIAKLRLTENNKSILNAYKKMYFQWMISINILANLDDSVKNMRKMRDQVARNFRAGLSEDDDLQRASAAVLQYENQYQDYQTYLNNIRSTLSVYIDSAKLNPDENDFNSFYALSSDNAYDFVSFDKTNYSKIIDLTLKNLDYSKGINENKMLPSLNAFAGITQKNITIDSSNKFSKYPYRDYNVGFEFSYKLGNNSYESDLESVNIQIQAMKYEYERTTGEYKKNLMKLKESSEGIKSQIKNTATMIEVLNRQSLSERKKYGQGRLPLSYVIDTENNITTKQTALINLKYQLIAYYIDYMDAVK